MGSERRAAHGRWYRIIADHYDHLYDPDRPRKAYPFLHDVLRRRGPVRDVLDVACGTFAIDLLLLKRGYCVIGRDLSADMLRVARRTLAAAGCTADVAPGDMRTVRLPGTFDAVLCLGTAFNYLTRAADVRRALDNFRRHLRPGGVLVLDLTNFDPWIRRPQNARAEVDYRAEDGTRLAIYAFNEQDASRTIHTSRMLTVLQKGGRIDIGFDETPLRVWTKEGLARELARHGLRPLEWWGDLRLGARYVRSKSPRLVSVSRRE